MKKKFYCLGCLILLFSLVISSCKIKQNEENNDPLYLEVMKIHDDVMPEMSTIHKLKRVLKNMEDTTIITPKVRLIKDLDEADEAMMSWMAEFSLPENKKDYQSYLEKEKEKIIDVSNKMYKSIEKATSFVDSLNKISSHD